MPQSTHIFIWQPRWNMISPVIFAGALTIFAGALPSWPHPGDGAVSVPIYPSHALRESCWNPHVCQSPRGSGGQKLKYAEI